MSQTVRVKNELNRGDYVDPRMGRSPFFHWASEWLDTAAHLTPTTRVDYETMLRVHVLPVFADQAIAAIQPGDVRRFIADKVASGAAPGTHARAPLPDRAVPSHPDPQSDGA